ncbi:MAG TPA: hypothetical protein VJ783_12800, partial [Pirellulales bacterium]|nr:hypothetical protein [Pirellulales bacterium]
MWFISRRPGKRSRDHARAHRFVPQLEILENRALLSTLTVLNTFDSGAGSLRDTIAAAKSGDTIMFAPSLNGQTITLTSDQLTINKSLNIEGPGAGLLTISGNDSNRIFDVSQGLVVTIAGLTLSHGRAQTAGGGGNENGGGGGAILNASSTLALADDVLSFNEATLKGGGISNLPGSALTATNSTFIDNRAIGKATDPSVNAEGGAIWNAEHGVTATVIGCTFTGNQAIGADGGVIQVGPGEIGAANGGAIHNEGQGGQADTLVVENSTFTNNQAIGGNGGNGGKSAGVLIVGIASGGGIANDDGGSLVVSGCTFSDNQSLGGSNASAAAASGSGRIGLAFGGGLATEGPTTVTNSTFDHNEALGGSNNTGGSGTLVIGRGAGGGIDSFSFTIPVILNVSNCSFTGNQALGGAGNRGGISVGVGVGGGLENERVAMATVTNSTFTGNKAIGGAGAAGGDGTDGLGGGLANLWGAALTLSNCVLTDNQALGGAGGAGGNGGNGFGGALFNDGLSIFPDNAGT